MLHAFLWILNISLTTLLIGFIIRGVAKRKDDIVGALILFLTIYCLLFWVLIGSCLSCRTSSEIVIPYVVKTKTAVVIEYDGVRKIYEDAKTYNEAVDSGNLSYKLITDYNMYGIKINRNFEKYYTTEVENLQQ